jgi:hypothetical protein
MSAAVLLRMTFTGPAVVLLAAAAPAPTIHVLGTGPSSPSNVRLIVTGDCAGEPFRIEISPVPPPDAARRPVAVIIAGQSLSEAEIDRFRSTIGNRRVNFIAEGTCGSVDEPGIQFWINLNPMPAPMSGPATTAQLTIVNGRMVLRE